MRVLCLAVLVLASCLAPKVGDDDGGAPSDAMVNSACNAAGGSCVPPGPACVAVVSVSIACGGEGAICCTTVAAAIAPATSDAATTTPVAAAAVVPAADAAPASTAPGCSTACEITCEGDPNCITMCGC